MASQMSRWQSKGCDDSSYVKSGQNEISSNVDDDSERC